MTKHTFDPDFLPFKSRQIALKNGARTQYVDGGSGPRLVLPHGNPTSSFLYHYITLGLPDAGHFTQEDAPGEIVAANPFGIAHAFLQTLSVPFEYGL